MGFVGMVLHLLGIAGLVAERVARIEPAVLGGVHGGAIMALVAGAGLVALSAKDRPVVATLFSACAGVALLVGEATTGWADGRWWQPWVVWTAIGLLVFAGGAVLHGLFLALVEIVDEFGGAGLGAAASALGAVVLVADAFVDLGGWDPAPNVLGVALATGGLVPLPLKLGGPTEGGRLSGGVMLSIALGGTALAATGITAMTAFDLATWLWLLVMLPVLLGAALLVPPLLYALAATSASPAAVKLRYRAAAGALTFSMVPAALSGYVWVLVDTLPLWGWAKVVLTAPTLLGLFVSITSIGGFFVPPPPERPLLERLVPERSGAPTPAPMGAAAVESGRVPEGSRLRETLDRLAEGPDRVYRLLPRGER